MKRRQSRSVSGSHFSEARIFPRVSLVHWPGLPAVGRLGAAGALGGLGGLGGALGGGLFNSVERIDVSLKLEHYPTN